MFYFQKIEEIKLKEIELKKSTEVRQLETFGKIQSQTEKKKKVNISLLMHIIYPRTRQTDGSSMRNFCLP